MPADSALPATIDVRAAIGQPWDAVIIGAGPAGAVAAREAARAGLTVLLVDRQSFPRDKVCGGCLNHGAVSALRGLGLGDRLAGCEGLPFTSVRLHHERRWASIAVPPGLAISRRRFDAMLVQAAIDAGSKFLPDTSALLELTGAESHAYRTIEIQHHRDGSARIAANVVVVADGLARSSLRASSEFQSQVAPSARIGLGGIGSRGVLPLERGTIDMAIGGAGYVGAVLIDEDHASLAAALTPDFVKRCGSPAASAAKILKDAGMPGRAPLDAVGWQGTLPLTRRTVRPFGRRVLIIGDAAGYVEPFTGEGMAWAIGTALASIPFIQQGTERWDVGLEDAWAARYRAVVSRPQLRCAAIARALRSPLIVHTIIRLLERWPSAARPVVTRLGAHVKAGAEVHP